VILDASRVVTRSGFFISDFFLTFPRLKSQISLTFYYLYPTIKVRGDLWMVFLKTLSLEEIHILDVTCLRYVLLILDAWSAMPKSVYTVVFIFPYSAHKFIPLLTNNIFFLDFPHIFRYWHKFPWHFQVFPDRGISSLTFPGLPWLVTALQVFQLQQGFIYSHKGTYFPTALYQLRILWYGTLVS